MPPEGVEPWDWDKTWKALVGKRVADPEVITVSKHPADKARFGTINEALDQAKPGQTIRVLDDSTYEEWIEIRPQHVRITLESTNNATLRTRPKADGTMTIQSAR